MPNTIIISAAIYIFFPCLLFMHWHGLWSQAVSLKMYFYYVILLEKFLEAINYATSFEIRFGSLCTASDQAIKKKQHNTIRFQRICECASDKILFSLEQLVVSMYELVVLLLMSNINRKNRIDTNWMSFTSANGITYRSISEFIQYNNVLLFCTIFGIETTEKKNYIQLYSKLHSFLLNITDCSVAQCILCRIILISDTVNLKASV